MWGLQSITRQPHPTAEHDAPAPTPALLELSQQGAYAPRPPHQARPPRAPPERITATGERCRSPSQATGSRHNGCTGKPPQLLRHCTTDCLTHPFSWQLSTAAAPLQSSTNMTPCCEPARQQPVCTHWTTHVCTHWAPAGQLSATMQAGHPAAVTA